MGEVEKGGAVIRGQVLVEELRLPVLQEDLFGGVFYQNERLVLG